MHYPLVIVAERLPSVENGVRFFQLLEQVEHQGKVLGSADSLPPPKGGAERLKEGSLRTLHYLIT
jgi:hypothetical protein